MRPSRHTMIRSPLAVLLALVFTVEARCQTQKTPPQLVAANDQQVTQALLAFAHSAESYKMPSRARKVYEQILDHYDIENATARKGLGWKQVKGEWQPPAPGQIATDAATPDQRKRVQEAWVITQRKVTKLHRDLGIALLAQDQGPLGKMELERALAFDPDDVESHKALGHEQLDGFYGSADQLAFVRRMRELLAKAKELREKDYQVTPLEPNRIPKELQQSELPFEGARSEHFQHWVLDSAESAADSLRWAERAYELDAALVGADKAKAVLRPTAVRWLAIVRTQEQRDQLLEKVPAIRGEYGLAEAKLFGGMMFRVGNGGEASFDRCDPEVQADSVVAHVTKRHVLGGRNSGLGEGLVHATTWLLCGTVHSSYCSLPKTVSGPAKLLGFDPKEWTSRLQDEIEAGTDYPLVQLPRERSDNFHEDARIKSWSFMLWMVARYPDRWLKLVDKLSGVPLMPDDVAKIFQEVLDRSVGEVEEEWRSWARRDSRIGKASGVGN